MKREWDFEHLYFEGDRFYADVLAAIGAARDSIDFETYIFDMDEIGERFSDALAEAAERGVHVRILVDGIGGGAWADRFGASIQGSGAIVRVYHPVRLASLVSRWWRDFGFNRPPDRNRSSIFSRLNRRDHRKMILIDRSRAFVGSLNISASHAAEFNGAEAWRDTAMEVRGLDLSELSIGFEYVWRRSHDLEGKRKWMHALLPTNFRRKRAYLVRSNFTVRLRRRNFREFSIRLRSARERIWITNAYLAPSKPTVRKLVQAAKRGVDVRILVPRKSDVFFMPWVATSYYPPLLKGGVKIYEYLPRFIHAKSVIIDQWAMVGTSNLNRRSLLKDFEVDVIVSKPETRTELTAKYLDDLRESAEILAPETRGLTAWLGRIVIWLMKELI